MGKEAEDPSYDKLVLMHKRLTGDPNILRCLVDYQTKGNCPGVVFVYVNSASYESGPYFIRFVPRDEVPKKIVDHDLLLDLMIRSLEMNIEKEFILATGFFDTKSLYANSYFYDAKTNTCGVKPVNK